MYFYDCPICESRLVTCFGDMPPKTSKCPECETVLAFVKERRTLIDKIKDAYTPIDFIGSLVE